MKDVYINIWDYVETEDVFNIFIGGRGCGKTDSALRGLMGIDCPYTFNKFAILRRTDTELETAINKFVNPFSDINLRYNRNMTVFSENVLGFKENDVIKGYAFALTTIKNIRGVTLSGENRVDCIVYDEFICEPHARPIKGESFAFFNAYETINRNREFEGLPPCRCIMLANMFNVASPILASLNLVNTVYEMQKSGKTESIYIPERRLRLTVLDEQKFVNAKKQTALGMLTDGLDYSDIAITQTVHDSDIKRIPLKEFKAVMPIGKICIWEHKTNDTIYITEVKNDVIYTEDEYNIASRILFCALSNNQLVFADANAKHHATTLFANVFKKRR